MSKTIELIPTDKGSESIVLILSGDTISIGNRNGTRYRLNAFDHTTLQIWLDDTRHYHKQKSESLWDTPDHAPFNKGE